MTATAAAAPITPGSPRARQIFFSLLGTVAVTLMGLGIVAPLMPVFAKDLGASGLWLGLMLAAFSISRGIVQPIVGVMSDRYGRTRFIVAGLAIYTAMSFVYIAARSPYDLTMMRLVHGAGSAMVIPIITAYLADITPPRREGEYMAYLNMAIFGGLGAGPLVGGILFDSVGIESAFVLMGGLSAVALGLAVWLLPPGRGGTESEEVQALAHLRETLRSSRVLGILSFRLFTAIAIGPTYVFLPILMKDPPLASSAVAVGLVITIRVMVNAVVQLPFGFLADRTNRVFLSTVGTVGTGVGVLLIPQADSMGALIGIVSFMGVFEGLTWASVQAMSVEEGRHYGQGSVQGLFQMAMSVGLLIGSFFGGILMDAAGIDWVFVIAGAVIGAGAFLSAAMFTVGRKPRMAVEVEPHHARPDETHR